MTRIPDALPLLSPGRHRRRRHGVCLMELTSIVAGEPFSDRPDCTDPALAAVARAVNDYSSHSARQRLAVLAADLSVAGRSDPELGYRVGRRCLLTALPYAEQPRRRVLAVGLLGLDRASRDLSRGWRPDFLDFDSELGLMPYDGELAAAGAFLDTQRVSPREYLRRGLPIAVEAAVATIAERAPDADGVLRDLLTDCLDDGRRSASVPQVPSAVCAASSDTSVSSRR
jgi:hypothetical protein